MEVDRNAIIQCIPPKTIQGKSLSFPKKELDLDLKKISSKFNFEIMLIVSEFSSPRQICSGHDKLAKQGGFDFDILYLVLHDIDSAKKVGFECLSCMSVEVRD